MYEKNGTEQSYETEENDANEAQTITTNMKMNWACVGSSICLSQSNTKKEKNDFSARNRFCLCILVFEWFSLS